MERLTPTAPYDFPQMLRRPLSRISKAVAIDPETASYSRALRLPTRIVPVTVTDAGAVDQPDLRLAYPDHLSEDEGAAVRATVRRMFSTGIRLDQFHELMSATPEWEDAMERFRGLRPILDADPFESMVKVIIGQQLNVRFAAALTERLVDLGGETVEWNGVLLPVFPSAEQVARWSYDELQRCSFSRRKAEYVVDFARSVVDGRVDLDALWRMTDGEIGERLTSLRGIGRWTVECFLLFGMGRPDVLPAADIGVQNAVRRLYGMDRRPGEDEVRRLAEPWAPWRSYATYYLWQSLIRA